MNGSNPTADDFVPASSHLIPSGDSSVLRDWVVLSVLNGLVVGLSHLIFSFYALTGPGALVLNLFHQCNENLIIASVYLLMAYLAPNRRPFTVNAVVWGVMGLMMGWWPLLVAALPAGLLADQVIRRAVPRGKHGRILVAFAFYSTMLCFANFWPFLLLKHGAMIQRLAAMHPATAQLVELLTVPVFASQLAATLLTGLLGGYMAQKLIAKHFNLQGAPS